MLRLIYIIYGNDLQKKQILINSITENFRVNKLTNISNYWYVVQGNFNSYNTVIEKYFNLNLLFISDVIENIPKSIILQSNKVIGVFLDNKINNSNLFLKNSIEYVDEFFNKKISY